MDVDFNDLIYQLDLARDAHASVSRACSKFNDRDGELYHAGLSAAYAELFNYFHALLSEPDSESGR